jgi:tRNA dimethylallyltransferase
MRFYRREFYMLKNGDRPRILAVVGPTASGKSALALALAQRLGGEIVSCDSMQIYRGMDIGTAKPTRAEQALVPHHLIDIREPEQPFSAVDFAEAADAAVRDICARGRGMLF